MIPVLDRITHYRDQKGWSEYQLATESGLTQSTISSWYRKKLLPSIPSLEKICNAFGITLSQFFAESEMPYTLTKPLRRTTACINRIYKDSLKGYAYSPRIAFSLISCTI